MSKAPPINGLQLEQDLRFQRKSWVAQRIGWGILALILVAALLGLFGAGPLSYTQVSSRNGLLQLRYERFLRRTNPSTLQFVFAATAQAPDQAVAQLWLSLDYVEALRIEEITPPPVRVTIAADGLLYTFAVANSAQPAHITFHLSANQIGLIAGRVGLPNQPPLPLRHFVYP